MRFSPKCIKLQCCDIIHFMTTTTWISVQCYIVVSWQKNLRSIVSERDTLRFYFTSISDTMEHVNSFILKFWGILLKVKQRNMHYVLVMCYQNYIRELYFNMYSKHTKGCISLALLSHKIVTGWTTTGYCCCNCYTHLSSPLFFNL